MGKANYIFDVVGDKKQQMRGFLDMDSQEIVIYDDSKGKELFRIGGQQQTTSKSKVSSEKGTLTFEINNASNVKQTATLFGANLDPLVQPLGVTVVIKEIQDSVFNSHNYIRKDILSKKLQVTGLTYVVEDSSYLKNPLTIGKITPYGIVKRKELSLLNNFNEFQFNKKRVEIKDFQWLIDSRDILYVPVEPNSKTTIVFDIVDDTYSTSEVSSTKRESTPISYSGNNNELNFDGEEFIEKKRGVSPAVKVCFALAIGVSAICFALSKIKNR